MQLAVIDTQLLQNCIFKNAPHFSTSFSHSKITMYDIQCYKYMQSISTS